MPGFSENNILQEAEAAAESGQWENALDNYRQLIAHNPTHEQALLGAGVCSLELGAYAQAIDYLSTAQAASTASAAVRYVLAESYRRLGGQHRRENDIKAAEECLEEAYRLSPSDPAILNDMAVILRAKGDLTGAETLYRAAIKDNPGQALLHANLGNVLEAAGRFRLARDELQTAYDLDPDAGDIASNLAALLTKLHRPEQALPLLERKAADAPGRWDVLTNLGVARLNAGDVSGAEQALRHSLELNPDNAEAHYNLAWVLLLTGRFEDGWAAYEWRWQMEHFSSDPRPFHQPRWDGERVDGTLLVHAEQGLGDTIQFLRLAKRCKALCSKVVMEVQSPLVHLARRFDADIDVVERGAPLPDFDVHAPMMSLPNLLGLTVSTIEDAKGYLSMPPELKPDLQLPATEKLKIGFVWSGSNANKMDAIRSMRAEVLRPLIERADVFPVNLQVGGRDADWAELVGSGGSFDASAVVEDFSDTAAVVGQLDAVVSVDTAVVHLAGALGQRCFLMVPHMPDYRWMLGRTDTPWYDSVTIVRQTEPRDWIGVIHQIGALLDDI